VIRIVAGIDSHYVHALHFLERLRFPSAEVRLLHVVESLLPDKTFPDLGPDHPLTALMAEKQRLGREELEAAKAILAPTGYSVATEIMRGDPARCIIEYSTQCHADLIAVGSSQKGQWGSLFFGSVTKALTAAAEQSILIAKSAPRSDQGLKVVLATDHSAYADACVRKLLTWDIGGIRHITVLTSLEHRIPEPSPETDPSDTLTRTLARTRDEAQTKSDRLCQEFRSRGIECATLLEHDHPQNAIARAMQDSNADLLILGARGHGFWDRLRLGSVSHFQVVATPHNVLVLRTCETIEPRDAG
jgi:nucleotide-binding universal stress UspA family protein